jgi:hypothetical protein
MDPKRFKSIPIINNFVEKEMFEKYKRTDISEMRPYIKGEDLTTISVSSVDNPDLDMGMVARNPKNHKDQWYVARKYFEDNFKEICNYARDNEAITLTLHGGIDSYDTSLIQAIEKTVDEALKPLGFSHIRSEKAFKYVDFGYYQFARANGDKECQK